MFYFYSKENLGIYWQPAKFSFLTSRLNNCNSVLYDLPFKLNKCQYIQNSVTLLPTHTTPFKTWHYSHSSEGHILSLPTRTKHLPWGWKGLLRRCPPPFETHS